jgi:Zn-dependent protease
MYMNVSLAVFNLLPFPPLDGSKVLETFLPASAQPVLEILEQHGYIIMMILIYVGFTSAIIRPIIGIVEYLLYLGTPFR